MKNSRFKVATLLMAGFGTACAFLAIVIGLAISEQAKLNAITTTIAEDRWPKIETSTDLRLRMVDIAVSLRNLMLTNDKALQQRQIDNIAQYRKDVEASLAQLDRTVITPAGRAMLARTSEAIRVYASGQQRLIELVQGGKDAEARVFLESELKPMLQACREALGAQIGNEVQLMNASRQQAADAYVATRRQMLLLGALAMLVSAGVAAMVILRLRRALGGEPDQAASTAARIADGDLTGVIALRAGDCASMMYEMEHMRDELGRLVSNVRQDTDQIAAASSQIAAGNLDLSARTEQQAASLEETAAAMEQLTATVEQNSANADQADILARQASSAATRGEEAVAAVTVRMQDIAASAGQMADIISLIDGIAFQTNILALNAAVEAARAGDAGRGFAVVAAEVRQLAQRSASAARQIGDLIKASTAHAQAGAGLVEQTSSAMHDIMASVTRVEEIMTQIRHASAEQHAGIVSCNRAIVEMDQATQQNAALVEEVAAAAASLQRQSGQLAQAVSRFRIDAHSAAARAPSQLQPPAQRVQLAMVRGAR